MIVSKNKLFLASLTILASLSCSHKAFAMDSYKDNSNAKILTPLRPLQNIPNLTDFDRIPRKNNKAPITSIYALDDNDWELWDDKENEMLFFLQPLHSIFDTELSPKKSCKTKRSFDQKEAQPTKKRKTLAQENEQSFRRVGPITNVERAKIEKLLKEAKEIAKKMNGELGKDENEILDFLQPFNSISDKEDSPKKSRATKRSFDQNKEQPTQKRETLPKKVARITNDEKATIKKFVKLGWDTTRIAKEINRSSTSVSKQVEKIKLAQTPGPLDEKQKRTILQLRGILPLNQIATEAACTVGQVRDLIKNSHK